MPRPRLSSKRKGQEIAGEVFLFIGVIMVGIFIFILLSTVNLSDENQMFSGSASTNIERSFSEIRLRSAATTSMNDHLWRFNAGDDGEDIRPGEYNQMLAREVLALYFSTPEGGQMYMGARSLDESNVETDLKNYFGYKLENYIGERTETPAYRLRVTSPGDSDSPLSDRKTLTVRNGSLSNPATVEYTLPLAGGSEAYVSLDVQNPGKFNRRDLGDLRGTS